MTTRSPFARRMTAKRPPVSTAGRPGQTNTRRYMDVCNDASQPLGVRLGSGAYGQVFRCASGVCKVQPHPLDAPALRELASVRRLLNCRGVVQLQRYMLQDKTMVLCFPESPMDLARTQLPPSRIRQCIFDILCALVVCHDQHIMHRDVKPENILLDSAHFTLCDFGLSAHHTARGPTHSSQTTTLWYRAPEVLLGNRHYTTSIDIWSLGCVFLQLLTGDKFPFKTRTNYELLLQIFALLGRPTQAEMGVAEYRTSSFPNSKRQFHTFMSRFSHDAQELDLLASLLEWPSRRRDARTLLCHSYFKQMHPRAVVLAASRRWSWTAQSEEWVRLRRALLNRVPRTFLAVRLFDDAARSLPISAELWQACQEIACKLVLSGWHRPEQNSQLQRRIIHVLDGDLWRFHGVEWGTACDRVRAWRTMRDWDILRSRSHEEIVAACRVATPQPATDERKT